MTENKTFKTLLALGRVSNLPTVWTNCMAAMALVAGRPPWWAFLLAVVSMTLFYTGGMFLNDAFDREIDAKERPERPIPSGAISASRVFFLGFFQLGIGIAIVGGLSLGKGIFALVSALGLAGFILAYNIHHKNNPLSPVLMGLCRVAVYTTVGLLFLPIDGSSLETLMQAPGLRRLLSGAGTLLLYLMLLTYFAKREGKGIKPPVPIPYLIAGISVVDGIMMFFSGYLILALFSTVAFRATLFMQRWVKGT